jgi:hypothetical protein
LKLEKDLTRRVSSTSKQSEQIYEKLFSRILVDKPKLEYLDATYILSKSMGGQFVEAILPCIPSVQNLIMYRPEKRILEVVNWEKLRCLKFHEHEMAPALLNILPHHKLTSLETLVISDFVGGDREPESLELLKKLPSFGMTNLRRLVIRAMCGNYFEGVKAIAEANHSLKRFVIDVYDLDLESNINPADDLLGIPDENDPYDEREEEPGSTFPEKCLETISLPIKYVKVADDDRSVWGSLILRQIKSVGFVFEEDDSAEELFLACYEDDDAKGRLKELETVLANIPKRSKKFRWYSEWLLPRIEIEKQNLKSAT